MLWRKAWAAGREPEAADITIILGSGPLRSGREPQGSGHSYLVKGPEGLHLIQQQRQGHSQGSLDRGPAVRDQRCEERVWKLWEALSPFRSSSDVLGERWESGVCL